MSMIAFAQAEDVPLVHNLLERCGLPKEGLDTALETLIVAREAELVIGCAALEVHGNVALLRSVAVDPVHRSAGLGQQMVEMQLVQARRHGLQEVYLLTETAAEYFPRFGFQLIDRCAASPALHQSVEWISACPASAHVMVLSLKSREKQGMEPTASFW
jgi:amino-acid N-acetyltransferase